MAQRPHVIIYSDGGAQPNPGEGGWAALLMSGTRKLAISGYARKTTNNIMEATAVLEALRRLKRPCTVDLVVDSKYVLYGILRIQKGQLLQTNVDVWKEVAEAMRPHRVTVTRVNGHSGNVWNEFVDKLATLARKNRKGEVTRLAN